MDSKQTIQIIPAPGTGSLRAAQHGGAPSYQRRPSAGGAAATGLAAAPAPGGMGQRPRASSLSERMRTGGGTSSGRGAKGGGGGAGDSLAPPLDTLAEHYAAGSELALDKALASDIDDEQAFYLLRTIAAHDRVFHTMTERDLRVLCHLFSVLKLPKGEEIMKVGEQATFFALVLNGELTAVLESGASFAMPAGSWLGEMAYFEGGGRSADIVVSSDALLAVVTYDDVNALRGVNAHGDVYAKLVRMLAVVSLQKLRGQIERLTEEKTHAHANTVLQASAPSSPTASDRQKLAAVSLSRVSAPTVQHRNQRTAAVAAAEQKKVTASPGGTRKIELGAGAGRGGGGGGGALTASGRTKHGGSQMLAINAAADEPAHAPAETLYAKRLAKEPKLRPELYLTGLAHVQLPAPAPGQAAPAPESNPLMAFTGAQLLSLDRGNAEKLFAMYHDTSAAAHGKSKGIETREMKALARDVAERVLWNFAESVKRREPAITPARLLEAVNEERPYLLPRGDSGQPDKTVIGNMSKHLTHALSIDPSKQRKITVDMFCLQWNKAMLQLMHKTQTGAGGGGGGGGGAKKGSSAQQQDGGMSCCML